MTALVLSLCLASTPLTLEPVVPVPAATEEELDREEEEDEEDQDYPAVPKDEGAKDEGAHRGPAAWVVPSICPTV